jgi:hypothetical protein
MTTSALRTAVFPFLTALAAASLTAGPARANDKADCTAAQKSAQTDKAAGRVKQALTELATCARPVCPKAMQKQCTDLTATVVAGQPTVVFSAKDAAGNAVTNVTVSVDGAVVTSNLDGTAVPLDPGSHAMKFEMDGATTVEKQIDVADGTKGQTIAIDLDANKPAAPVATGVVVPIATDAPGSMTDVHEDPTKRYYFIGLRYRENVIPQFMLNIFVNGGKTLFSNSIGAEIDMRHDNFSLIPAITYTEYGTGDVVFSQKGKDPTDPGNWSVVDSSLKGIYFSADLLWSAHIANHWDFEYGAGFGLGVIFGNLGNNWVYAPDGGQVSPSDYAACTTATQMAGKNGCQVSNHNGATAPGKIDGYEEPSWANGGSKPNIFPLINFPQLGLRYKPIKQMEARVGLGFSLTGFWFGISANYGLEKPTK